MPIDWMKSTRFQKVIDVVICPRSTTYIKCVHNFNQPLDKVKLPESLGVLFLGSLFNQPRDKIKLPLTTRLEIWE